MPFLLLPVSFVPVGVAIAWTHGYFDPLTAVLTLVGALCLHSSVNVLNDYFDFKSGIDIITTPTPFSGGSRILNNKQLRPSSVLTGGLLLLVAGSGIGAYFVFKLSFDPVILVLLSVAIISVAFYSQIISRWGVGEMVVGLNFGPLLLLGTYYVQAGRISLEPVLAGLVLGIMTAGLLYNNEFPDCDADKEKGRYHLVARMGKKNAARGYKFLMGSAYAVVVVSVALRLMTPFALISFLTIPLVIRASRILEERYDKIVELIPGMAYTVKATLLAGALLFTAYLVDGVILR